MCSGQPDTDAQSPRTPDGICLDNKITVTRFAELFNEGDRKGNRTGTIRFVDIPYTRRDGQILRKIENAEHARQMGMRSERWTDEVIRRIKSELLSGAATAEQLEKEYYHGTYAKIYKK
jgi:hypothetical protein